MTTSGPSTVAFAVRGPISRADLPGLCERIRASLAESCATLALCDVHGVEPDAVTVDALARLQLVARRCGCQVRLRHASDDLLDLIAFMGLRDVVPESGLRVEPGGKAEEREDGLGVEEERDLGDRAG
jgi:ABC-type transporter Mla MlaB component